MKKKAVVLLSGGQDSTTCLFLAKDEFEPVAVGFDYGQTHKIELDQAKKIAIDAGVDFRVINLRGVFGGSSLTDDTDHNKPSHLDPNLPASFTSGRNVVFLSIAGAIAAQVGARDVFTGVCQTDFSGYPDCRRVVIDAMQLAISLGYGIGDVKIHTPLMYLSKAETWKLANDRGFLDVIVRDTITGYDGDTKPNEWGMGNESNPASRLRAAGWREARERGWV